MSLNSANELHVVIDIEALGIAADSVILSIGAVPVVQVFDNLVEAFYMELDENSQPERAKYLEIIAWWNNQVTDGIQPRIPCGDTPLIDGIRYLFGWLAKLPAPEQELIVWSNGTDFDIPILCHAARQFSLTPPWKYNNVRDIRTMRKQFPEVTHEWIGSKHHAHDDAYNEMIHLVNIDTYIENLKAKANGQAA